MSTQEEAFQAIDQERDYQILRWATSEAEGINHSNVEFLVYIQDYVQEALHFASRNNEQDVTPFTQDSLRKIAALAVAAMEQNGVRFRNGKVIL
jgi:hypothetical protein